MQPLRDQSECVPCDHRSYQPLRSDQPLSGLVHAVDRRRLKIRKNKDEARVLHIDFGGAQPS